METFWFFRLRFRRCCDSTFIIPTPTPSNRTWIGLLLTPRDVLTFSAVVVIKVKTLSWLLSHRKTIALKVFEISVIITNSAIQDYNHSDGRKLWSYGGNVPRTNYVPNMKCSSLRLSTAENENGFIELFFQNSSYVSGVSVCIFVAFWLCMFGCLLQEPIKLKVLWVRCLGTRCRMCDAPFAIAQLGQKCLEAASTLKPLNSCITVHSLWIMKIFTVKTGQAYPPRFY